jgi:GNAT superfamily N-acetyltransferase
MIAGTQAGTFRLRLQLSSAVAIIASPFTFAGFEYFSSNCWQTHHPYDVCHPMLLHNTKERHAMLATTSNTQIYQEAAERAARPELIITQMRPEHFAAVANISTLANHGYECYPPATLAKIVERFPDGQFVALLDGQVASYAITMRTHRSPGDVPLTWYDAIGSMTLRNHWPSGEWLYGVDFVVDPSLRKMGIGSKMYAARFDLVRRLNLRGMYAGGMLMGYHRYEDTLTPTEYALKVMSGELQDPTVSMQMHRGFKPRAVIEDYTWVKEAGNCAVLIEWQNPEYRPVLTPLPVPNRINPNGSRPKLSKLAAAR